MGRTGPDRITIINPKGESYDMDRFGMIVSTREDGLIPDLRLQPPKPTSEVEQEPRRYGRGDGERRNTGAASGWASDSEAPQSRRFSSGPAQP